MGEKGWWPLLIELRGAASRRRRRSYRALTIKQIGAIYRVLGTPTTSLSHPHP